MRIVETSAHTPAHTPEERENRSPVSWKFVGRRFSDTFRIAERRRCLFPLLGERVRVRADYNPFQ